MTTTHYDGCPCAACMTDPARTTPYTVPRPYALRARDGYAWDLEHHARVYGPGDYTSRIVGYVGIDHRAVRADVAAIRDLTAIVGGYHVGDYVCVPTEHVRGLRIVAPSDRDNGPLDGCARCRVMGRAADGSLVDYDPDGPPVPAVDADGCVIVRRGDSYPTTGETATVPADVIVYVM